MASARSCRRATGLLRLFIPGVPGRSRAYEVVGVDAHLVDGLLGVERPVLRRVLVAAGPESSRRIFWLTWSDSWTAAARCGL